MWWIEQLMGTQMPKCRVCGESLVFHVYGSPLMVCPRCFPAEGLEGGLNGQ